MDFAIKHNAGRADMSWEPAGDISNNVWLSLNVKRGTLYSAMEFGNRFHLVEKNTPKAPALVEEYAREALKWLLETGRAKSIEITAHRDVEKLPNAILLAGEVVQKNGRRVPFEKFVEVA